MAILFLVFVYLPAALAVIFLVLAVVEFVWGALVLVWKIAEILADFIMLVILAPFRFVFAIIDAIFGTGEEPPQRVVTYREVEEPPPPQRPQPEVRYTPPPQPESRYTSDWSTVSKRYKEARYWTCEGCGVYCGGDGDQTLLHVHHLDLDSLNNAEWNLRALCVQCHGGMPGVGHKRLAGAAKTDGRWQAIDYLRWRQRNRR